MLKQRVITALIMLAILLPALFYPDPTPFCVVALVLLAAASWEWGRLNLVGQAGSIALALACALMCGLSWAAGLLMQPLPLLWSAAGIAWVLAGGWLLKRGVAGWPRIPVAVRLAGGLVILWLAWLAVAQARTSGIGFLLSVLMLVWAADIGAYFVGRGLGGRFSTGKLAPSISPGKTWEGVWGGIAGVVLLALIWLWVAAPANSSLYSRLADRHGLPVMLLAVVFLVVMSVVGDLVESLIKRSAGAKDSSGLLPGHGGVLDRVDALLPTLPLALMLVSL
jgi:phosphatidate cytidylyltransferase